ncbi:MAG: DUF4392 domain-containing protein [Theionarchaea archaeon]|nr:DUF4392 domain-containing protein [Theionarchaea archaeon]
MIEDIILEKDKRGMSALRKVLPLDFCKKAAEFLYKHMENVLIATGFYVSGFCETDGPVGAVMLGEALLGLGLDVSVVTDRYCYEVLKKVKVPFDVHLFPIAGEKESRKAAEDLMSVVNPSVLVSIERCGRAKDGLYYNMRGEDISRYTGRIDFLFDFPWTIGIGDGGNEIGMGNVYDAVKEVVLHGEVIASVVKTTHLVISSVSNWGVYGLLAYLSEIEGKVLLKREDKILGDLVKTGAIDSSCKKCELAVDGFSLEDTNTIIDRLLKQMNCD